MIRDITGYTVLRESTARGRRVYSMAQQNAASDIFQVYENPSYNKREAFYRCQLAFHEDKSARNFRICSFNTFLFTVAWDTSCLYNGEIEACTVFKTREYDYLVIHE